MQYELDIIRYIIKVEVIELDNDDSQKKKKVNPGQLLVGNDPY